MTEVYGIAMERLLDKNELDQLMSIVSMERRRKAEKFWRKEDAHRGLIGEGLVRTILRRKYNLEHHQISFRTGRYGKPFIAHFPSFKFNISHSGRWVVCAVDDEPVGIDVEEARQANLNIAKRFFSIEEFEWLMAREERERVSCFYELWTLKESYIKREGEGLSIPLDSFSIQPGESGSISCYKGNEPMPYFFKLLNLGPGYKAAVCSGKEVSSESITIIKIGDLIG